MMRVLHVTEAFEGGVGSHLCEILPLQVAELGANKVHVLLDERWAENLAQENGLVLHTYKGGMSRLTSAFRLYGRLQGVIQMIEPDVIHSHSSFAGLAARLPSLLTKYAPTLYCPHGWAFAQDVSKPRRHFYAGVERLLLGRTKGVICVSQHEKDLAIGLGLPGEKLRVIRNGIADLAPPLSSKRQAREMARDDEINLLFVGRFDRQKGIDVLVEAARLLRDESFHFHVVGKATNPDEEIEISGMSNVTQYGWVSREEVVRLFSIADAMVMPSRWEGLPIAGIEAFRSSLPIIASNCSALPELVSHDKNGLLFEVDNARALAECLRSLSREKLARMGGHARMTFEEHFRVEKQHQEIMELYRQFTAQPRSSETSLP